MVANDRIVVRNLNLDELAGVVNLYPWFGAARKELCLRLAREEGRGISETDLAANALYIGSRRIFSDIVRSARTEDWSDKNLKVLLDSLAPADKSKKEDETPKQRVRVVGGDFFSQDEYDSVREADDNIFANFARKVRSEETHEKTDGVIPDEFCTETLAGIYTEQGHFEQAKYIYSKLILRYPEKNAYFAALIEKLTQLTDN